MITVFFCIPAQIFIGVVVEKYYRRRLAGDDTPPTASLRLAYGAAYGLMASLTGLAAAFLCSYFIF
jgi:hypothetical protein